MSMDLDNPGECHELAALYERTNRELRDARSACHQCASAYDRVVEEKHAVAAERDSAIARASLEAAHHEHLRRERDAAAAEVERMRAVFAAALAYRLASGLGNTWDARRVLTDEVDKVLVATNTDNTNRCAVCGWTLQETPNAGCVRGNCSLRPRPERLYAPERAERESTPPSTPERER